MANPPVNGQSNQNLDGQNSLQGFLAQVRRNSSHPASNNLYAIEFGNIPLLSSGSSAWLNPGQKELGLLLSYYATEVSTPSRNLTTASVTNIGSAYNYATGTSFSGFNIQFILPKSMISKTFFERWQQIIANDANQYVRYYKDYCADFVRIYKMERGGGGQFSPGSNAPGLRYQIPLSNGTYYTQQAGRPQYNSVSGVWELDQVFPYNVSGITLTNGRSGLVQMNVSFYYERYRWISSISGSATVNPAATRSNVNANQVAADSGGLYYANQVYGTDFYNALGVDTSFAQSLNTGFNYDWSGTNTLEGGYEGEEIINATNFMNTPITYGIGTPAFLEQRY